MNIVVRAMVIVFTLVGSLPHSFVAFASDVAEPPLIEEVVVTAARLEQGVYDVPFALSVFDGAKLDNRGVADLVDIGKFVPNLTVTTFAAGHTSSANPFIRGIGTQDHLITTDPGVGVYVDGVYLGRQVGQHWNLTNIERVEVLRGPQGTLYGRNSIGGAVNIVTSRPGSNPERKIFGRIGTRGRIDVATHFDLNASDALGVTATAGLKRRGGIGDFLNLPEADVNVGETMEVAARVALAWQPNSTFSLTVAADANDGENGLNPYTTLIDEVPSGAVYGAGFRNKDVSADAYDNNTGAIDQTRTYNDARGLSLTGAWTFSDALRAKLLGSVRRSSYSAGLDDDGMLVDFLRFPESGHADQLSFEATLLGDREDLDFVVGIHLFEEDGANVQDPTVFLGFTGRFELAQELDSKAVFVNVGRALSDRLRVGAGMRLTRDTKRASTNVGIGTVTASRSWSETSWEASANYDVNDLLVYYASIQNGYQSGQFPARPYCLFADPNCFVASDNITAINYEVGVKGQPIQQLEIAAAAFVTHYRDLPYQVSTTAGAGFNTVNLVVDQQTNGMEWESTFHLGDAWNVQLAVGYLDVEIDSQQGVRPVAPLTPKLTLALSPEYRRSLDDGSSLTVRLDYSWRDDMWGEPSSDVNRRTRIDSRGILNFHVGWTAADGNWEIAVYGRNAADTRYDQARINTGDYLLQILSNDASEFGITFERRL